MARTRARINAVGAVAVPGPTTAADAAGEDGRFAPWPAWSRDRPQDLVRFVQYRSVLRLLGVANQAGGTAVPVVAGAGGGPAWDRLAALCAQFLARGVGYADEPPASSTTAQQIRPPDEVLTAPKHATCLDLAVTFAGACLDIGVHPMIVLLDPTQPGRPGHALVVCWLEHDWTLRRPGRSDQAARDGLRVDRQQVLDGLRAAKADAGAYLALDVARLARRAGTAPTAVASAGSVAHPVGVVELAAAGAARLHDPDWSWRVGIDVGAGFDPDAAYAFAKLGAEPLAAAYLDRDPADESALAQVKARNNVVRFLDRGELDLLLDWCQPPDESRTEALRLAVVHGVGGAGKTHLAAELCHRLAPFNWYTGFLTVRPAGQQDERAWRDGVAWLGRTVSPLLVVVDYAEARQGDVLALLRAVRHRPGGPTCVLLTARTVTQQEGRSWLDDIVAELEHDSLPHARPLLVALAEHHPQRAGVFRRALAAFTARRGEAEKAKPAQWVAPPPGRWTTLDLVMLAWLTARGDALPADAAALYDTILGHEYGYWDRAAVARYGQRARLAPQVWADLATCLTLLAPAPERVATVIRAVDGLGPPSADGPRTTRGGLLRRRHAPTATPADGLLTRTIADVLVRLLPVEAGTQQVTLRPDPIADHVMLRRLAADAQLLQRCLGLASDAEQLHVVTALTRAAEGRPDRGEATLELARRALDAQQDLWRPALAVAAVQAGPFLPALEALAQRPVTPLPLAELAADIPLGSANLRRLALIATERTAPAGARPVQGRERKRDERATATEAARLGNLANRQSEAGQREAALGTATEAVRLYQQLAAANPVVFTPDLAMSLNNLANRQSEAGQREAALDTAAEAVRLRQQLAAANPVVFTPDLAASLTNLANIQSQAGQREAALDTAAEAVRLYQQLAAANPVVFTPDLAASLNNLANRQSEAGQREAALDTAAEAVRLYQQLAAANPVVFTPDLAMSLNNLANRQSEAGQREAALDTAAEAVRLYQQLAAANPVVFTPDLAMSLNNLATFQSQAGQREAALDTAAEAVRLYQQLAAANPVVFTPDLAMSLTNLANIQSQAGQREAALDTAAEAVRLYQQLAAANPVVFTPDLAMSLNNLATFQSQAGQREAALDTAAEAVRLRQQLAAANPVVFTPNLATSLNNLANIQSQAGQREAALDTAAEAVRLYQQLAAANPVVFTPDLAMSLNNLATFQSQAGQREAALDTAAEAVRLYQQLAAANPAAFTPDLAMSLNNLATFQSQAGQREAALDTAAEAVRLYQQLAAANPAAFTPDLAGSLNNLATFQSEAGQREAALGTAAEAVRLYQQLAAANPAAFTPDLAGSLNNLATFQSEAGQREAALGTAAEAVRLRQQLAAANPAAFTPDLAGSLNNLANRQSEAGQREAALDTAAEAVRLYQQLAAANPAAFTPDLATSLNNLANIQSQAGQREAALGTAAEAVRLYQQLAAANPVVFTPDLAMSLNNLANRQSEAGQREAALGTAAEAVRLRQQLAAANPVVFTPNLATSLNNLLDRMAEVGRSGEGVTRFDEATDGLGDGVRASLLLARVRWRLRHDDPDGAAADFRLAASLADAESDPRWAGQARRAVRAAADELPAVDGDLPGWVRASLPDSTLDLLNRWAGADGWAPREALLREAYPELSSSAGRAALDTAAQVFPEAAEPGQLGSLLDDIAARGLQTVLAGHAAAASHLDMLSAWIDTKTWADSHAFVLRHPELLHDPRTVEALAEEDDDVMMRIHLAIARLVREHQVPVDDVYDMVEDPEAGEAAALSRVETGDLPAIVEVLAAAPRVLGRPFAAAYLVAVLTLLGAVDQADDDEHSPAGLMAVAAEQASDTQRAVGALRLRRLAATRPDLAAELYELVSVLEHAEPVPPA